MLLAVATMVGMIAAAVFAYFCWCVATWLLDPTGSAAASPPVAHPCREPPIQHCGLAAGTLARVPMKNELAWDSSLLAHFAALQEHQRHRAFAKDCVPHRDLEPSPDVAEEVHSPLPSCGREVRSLDLTPVAVKFRDRSRPTPPSSLEELQRGYAAHFAFWNPGCIRAF